MLTKQEHKLYELYQNEHGFDPHALAMALQLADMLAAEGRGVIWSSAHLNERDAQSVAHWLRAEVQRELQRYSAPASTCITSTATSGA